MVAEDTARRSRCVKSEWPQSSSEAPEMYGTSHFTEALLEVGSVLCQVLAALTVQNGGEGRNRTDECSFCRAVPYHLATPPTRTRNQAHTPSTASFQSIGNRKIGSRGIKASYPVVGNPCQVVFGF